MIACSMEATYAEAAEQQAAETTRAVGSPRRQASSRLQMCCLARALSLQPHLRAGLGEAVQRLAECLHVGLGAHGAAAHAAMCKKSEVWVQHRAPPAAAVAEADKAAMWASLSMSTLATTDRQLKGWEPQGNSLPALELPLSSTPKPHANNSIQSLTQARPPAAPAPSSPSPAPPSAAFSPSPSQQGASGCCRQEGGR